MNAGPSPSTSAAPPTAALEPDTTAAPVVGELSSMPALGSAPANTDLAGAEPSDAKPVDTEPAGSDVPWQRLSFRMVWINAVKFVLSLVPGFLGLVIAPTGPIWQLLVASGLGVISTVLDFKRWLKTRYRITAERVERRTGWLVRKYRYVPRDRIRNVDSSAKLRHRLGRLRVVHIGSGQASMSSTFKLDALSKEMAEELRRELMPKEELAKAEQETVISRVRWYWIFYNIFHFWALFTGALFLFSTYLFVDTFDIDLIDATRDLVIWADLGLWWSIGVGVALTFALGFTTLAFDFVAKYWGFELVRTTEGSGTALLTRQGLFSTRSVHRENRRIRGIQIHEPLLWRWIGLAETKVITTGIHTAREESANLLPRGPIREARHVATFVLPGEVLPLEAPLRRHPRSALSRRLLWATYGPASAVGVLAWLGATGVVPQWVWPLPLTVLPVTLALAVVAYLALGHTLVGPYLVVRSGALGRSTTVLQCGAVLGWRLRQSIFQRLWGRITIGIPTAAGDRYYRAPDAGTDQALAFIKAATPSLADEFLEGEAACQARTRAT